MVKLVFTLVFTWGLVDIFGCRRRMLTGLALQCITHVYMSIYMSLFLSGGFGGLVGAGVQYGLNGAKGIPSWRWLFIIEAAITVFIAIIALFILPDFPHTTKFLSSEEKAIATRRLESSSGHNDTERGPLLSCVKMAFADYKVWLLALIVITKTSAGAVTSFIPTLVATLGQCNK